MKLIVGLGNSGNKYKNTRHNVGFLIVDELVKEIMHTWRHNPDWMAYFVKSANFVVIKPTTYINRSGESVREVVNFYNLESDDVLVVHDDLDLPFGKIRLSFNSLSAGHQGVESVIKTLGTLEFARLRVGIGKPPKEDPANYVLRNFSKNQLLRLARVYAWALEAIRSYIDDGIEATMNRFN